MRTGERGRERIASQRHQIILNRVRQQGIVTINDLINELGVSAMTVRRDLDELDKQGLLQRTHGGATAAPVNSNDPPFIQRTQLNQPTKQAIAALAATSIADNDRIILDSGSTVAAVAPWIREKAHTTVITYSLPICQTLGPSYGARLICTGGVFEPAIQAFVGPLAERTLHEVRVDKAFIGATSVSLDDGFSNSSLQNRALQRIVLRVAREIYLLVDSSKFATIPFWLVASLEAVTTIITDAGISSAALDQYIKAGVEVRVVPVASTSVLSD